MSYLLSDLSVADLKLHQVESTAKSLQRAKQALIAYAVTYGDIDSDADGSADFPGEYGFLPCPDYNNGLYEGLEDSGGCGLRSVSKLGYLPWKTLDIPPLKDESGSCLLYAVTGEYKNEESATSNKTLMLNEDSNGMFQIVNDSGVTIRGINAEDRVVAIIFAPEKVLAGQSRNFSTGSFCGKDYANFKAYLDVGGGVDNSDVSATADTIDQFIHATAASIADDNPNAYNDRFVTITRDEIWTAIVKRQDYIQKMKDLTEALTMCLRDYAVTNTFDRLPWPAHSGMADYRINSNYNDNLDGSGGYAGRYPFIVDNSNSMIPGASVSDELFIEAGCNALTVSSGVAVDLQTPGSEYRKLWENWKDHFFYVVSRDYAPDNTMASCGTCITVAGITRAGLVVFGGSRQLGITRNEPIAGDVNTKYYAANYIEGVNADNFPDLSGNGNYTTATITTPETAKDIMYCLTTASPPTVTPC